MTKKTNRSPTTDQERIDRFTSYIDNLTDMEHKITDLLCDDIAKIIKDFVPSVASKNYNCLEDLLDEIITNQDEYNQDIDNILRFVIYFGIFLSINIARLQNKNGDSFQEFIQDTVDEDLSEFRDLFLSSNIDELEDAHEYLYDSCYDSFYASHYYHDDKYEEDDDLTEQAKLEEQCDYDSYSSYENQSHTYDDDMISGLVSSTEDYRKAVAHSLFDKFSPEQRKALARFISVCGIITDPSLIEDYGKE